MPEKSYKRYLLALIPLSLFGIIAYFFSDILSYVILAWVLSMIGAPLNGALKKLVGKTLASVLTLISFTILSVAILWLFIPPILEQARNFANIDYNQLIMSLEEPVNDWQDWLVDKGLLEKTDSVEKTNTSQEALLNKKHIEIVDLDSLLKKNGDTIHTGVTLVINLHDHSIAEILPPKKEDVLPSGFFEQVKLNLLRFFDPAKIPQVFSSILGFFGNLMIALLSIFFIAFFFLKEQGLFSQIVKALVANDMEDQTVHAIDVTSRLLIRYFVGIAIQVTIITIFITSVLSFLGYKNALLIGFFAAIMNVIPYIGPMLGAGFGMMILVSSNLGAPFYELILPKIIKLGAVFATMQLMDNFILQPNIFSKSVKAHPLEIFIVILVGAKLGGILGMVVAIPIYTILRVIAKVFLSEFKIVQRITSGM